MAPVSKNKIKSRLSAKAPVNLYGALEGKDGNPSTPTEFDESHPAEGEVFFKAGEDADAIARVKIVILNFIHHELHHNTLRSVPILEGGDYERELEVYHRTTYHGYELEVCVYFPANSEGKGGSEHKDSYVLVKLVSDDLSDHNEHFGSCVSTDASWTAEAQADMFTTKQSKLKKNYWTPRWKYVVNILRNEMSFRYAKNGDYIPPPTESIKDNDAEEEKVSDSLAVIEEEFSVFAGSTGTIIGTKGETINKIRASSGCTNIKMPERAEPRPKARDLVSITLSGTARQVAKAKKAIQVHVDTWANAPRPPRDGTGSGGSSGGGFSGGFGSGAPPPPAPVGLEAFNGGENGFNGAHGATEWNGNGGGVNDTWVGGGSSGPAENSGGW